MKGMRRPRWVFALHAWCRGYFWLPCQFCGRRYSGWEWGRVDYPAVPVANKPGISRGICARCALERAR